MSTVRYLPGVAMKVFCKPVCTQQSDIITAHLIKSDYLTGEGIQAGQYAMVRTGGECRDGDLVLVHAAGRGFVSRIRSAPGCRPAFREEDGWWRPFNHGTYRIVGPVIDVCWGAPHCRHGGVSALARERIVRDMAERVLSFGLTAPHFSRYYWRADEHGVGYHVAPEWTRDTGMLPKQTFRCGWARLIRPDDRERVVRAWLASAASAGVYQVAFDVMRRDGRYVPGMSIAVKTPRGGGGEPAGWEGVFLISEE